MISNRPTAKRLLPILVVASVAMYLVTSHVLDADEASVDVSAFASSNAQIVQAIGQVGAATLLKRVSVSATARSGAYRLYTLDVRGSAGSGTAVVRVEGDTGKGAMSLISVTP